MLKTTLEKKTYKREVAIVLLLGLSHVIYQGDVEMVKVIIWPFVSFAAAAFGLDVYSKLQSSQSGK
jgi:hypothetical protein